ncbi:2,3-diaminopropionate biosynthesis protein SbnB [Actinomadura sp. DC4]|uniref:2,3-diaminopropionate biosynthesis protein SbnB n=1 Tax=Actinomadura sp. DC4 TaxID=3055069 RepID=UPI0025B1490B|nr:2,3-diaminopropionate biosynthesis protein SbnB [Actinomadura sp. DC4]MDN3356442.1 2,3-diaminopropionate biosynthesis protein SbnB [Actinomadura sp. DC4]
MLILGNADVRRLLDGQHTQIVAAVRHAYLEHARGETTVPESVFLRFPHNARDRIITLPAYLGGDEPVVGVKWIASFPGNVAAGRERASAVIVLNSPATGQPLCMMEGSVVSSRRTAASAALASATLPGAEPVEGVSVIGCGVINAEILRFLRAVHPELRRVTIFDLDAERAQAFARRCAAELKVTASVVADADEALAAHPLVSLATTAATPHIDLHACRPGTLVLHVSLRDVTIGGVLDAVNIVDDRDHVLRAATSVHLAEQHVGHRGFIQATIGDLLQKGPTHPRDAQRVTLFSPFGLGVLDLAVADMVLRTAREQGLGVDLPDFLPA